MRTIERFLVALDSGPCGALARVALGMTIPPAFRILSGGSGGVWTFLALFIGLLVALRIVSALLRHALPFSTEAKKVWAERRSIAKQHDSYQWQKLFWVGLGLSAFAIADRGLNDGELAIAIFCLLGGGFGLVVWHRVDATRPRKSPEKHRLRHSVIKHMRLLRWAKRAT